MGRKTISFIFGRYVCVYICKPGHAHWKQYCTHIYLTQGQESSQDEKAAAALHAVNLDDQYGGAPVQVN